MINAAKMILLTTTAILGFFNTAFALLFGICTILFILLFVAPPPKDDNHRPPPNGGEPAPKAY